MAQQLPLFGLSGVKRELSSALTAEKKERAKAKTALVAHGRALKQLERARTRAQKGRKPPPPIAPRELPPLHIPHGKVVNLMAFMNAPQTPGTITSDTSAAAFEGLLRKHLKLGDRQIYIKASESLAEGRPSDVRVSLINLPRGFGGDGGGAEATNNRILLHVWEFAPDIYAPTPGKVKLEMSSNATVAPRLRAKTATPAQIAKYLADYLNKVVVTVPPKFTHSKPPAGY